MDCSKAVTSKNVDSLIPGLNLATLHHRLMLLIPAVRKFKCKKVMTRAPPHANRGLNASLDVALYW